MKKALCLIAAGCLALLTACGAPQNPQNPHNPQNNSGGFQNPGDVLGGGGTSTAPSAVESETADSARAAAGELAAGIAIPQGAVLLEESSKKTSIKNSGDYILRGSYAKIEVTAKDVHLFLDGAELTNDKKVIESKYALELTLFGENSVINTNESGSNAIDCVEDLLINGSGTLNITSTKNGIKAGSISIKDAALDIDAAKDGLHAEIDAYDQDDVTTAPVFSYSDGGFVAIDGASVTINSADDGIQVDTFVYILGDTALDITTNGGAPANVTETSSDNGDGKGIKAGPLDYGPEDANGDRTELANADYLILIENGDIKINANDDAVHSDSEIVLAGGTLQIKTGDDGIHAKNLLLAAGGNVTISKCYEGVEAAKIQISGGKYDITSVDDGINAADGTQNRPGSANTNCHLIISGGEITVNAAGDGLDSNGTILMTGGTVFVAGPTSGADAALDSDGGIIVDGGYLFAVGSLGMVETPANNSKQYVVSFARNSAMSAGTVLSLTKDDENLFTFTSPKVCQSVIISCPELKNGESYAIYGGDSELCTFTVSSIITTVGSAGGIGNPGGRPPMGGGPGGGFGGRR